MQILINKWRQGPGLLLTNSCLEPSRGTWCHRSHFENILNSSPEPVSVSQQAACCCWVLPLSVCAPAGPVLSRKNLMAKEWGSVTVVVVVVVVVVPGAWRHRSAVVCLVLLLRHIKWADQSQSVSPSFSTAYKSYKDSPQYRKTTTLRTKNTKS